MTTIKGFEDLEIWQEGVKLSVRVYELLKDCRDYGLRDQMQRSAVSVPSNISEGFERQTNKEFIQFLYIAKGSCGELRTQLIIASNLKVIEENVALGLIEEAKKLSSKIYKLIEYRKKY
ncbi:MAG: four helix bundle protein [Bacteroidota bacterium]